MEWYKVPPEVAEEARRRKFANWIKDFPDWEYLYCMEHAVYVGGSNAFPCYFCKKS